MPSRTRHHRRRTSLAAGLGLWIAAMAALPASAEVALSGDGGREGRNTPVNALRIEQLSATSAGTQATTTLEANTVERSAAGGTITNRSTVDTLILRAQGRGAVSEMAIGTVSDVTAGADVANTVTLGTSENIAIGAGARACTEIGTLGRTGVCN